MAADPKDRLHRLIDRLSETEANDVAAAVEATITPVPLTVEDIILPEAILPDDESADMMIATIRRWRRDSDDV